MNARRLRQFVQAAGACSLVLAAPASAQFPDFGGLVNKARSVQKIGDGLRKIGEPEEIKLGGDLAGLILGAAPLVEDPAKQRYVNRLGRWIALHSERPDLPWKFGIVASDDFNAFSMPGGYVLITRGLFDRMRNESELAGVLAHEVAHVVKRHHIEALQKTMREGAMSEFRQYVSTPSGPGGIAGEFSNALMASGKEMFARGLDKDDEFEADRMGVVIAARSGYSPYGLGGVLQTLSASAEDKGFALNNRTHPLPVERLERLDAAMGTRLDNVVGLVDDLPSFAALRAPPMRISPTATPRRKTRRP